MNKYKKITGLILFCALVLSFASSSVLAQVTDQSKTGLTGLLNETGTTAGWETEKIDAETGVAAFLGVIARYALSFIGVIFIIYVIFGGYLWLTAAGNEEKVTKAKKIIRDGVIGLVITTGAAAIYMFIQSTLGAATIAS